MAWAATPGQAVEQVRSGPEALGMVEHRHDQEPKERVGADERHQDRRGESENREHLEQLGVVDRLVDEQWLGARDR